MKTKIILKLLRRWFRRNFRKHSDVGNVMGYTNEKLTR